MKKNLIRGLVVVLILVGVFYLIVVPNVVSMVTDYPRYTFEYVTENPDLLEGYYIGDNRDPGDYGFDNFQELEYTTLYDGLNLSGWYIPSSKDSISKTLIINHGRTSNRLKTMKYLEIIDDYGLDSIYNIFIPDLRNSGKSDEAKTGMGYEFAEDIAASMRMLQIRFGQSDFVLWGFSMGAIGSATAINRPDLREALTENGITVDKLILGSPVSNVEKTLRYASQNMSIPGFVFDQTFNRFAKQSDGYVRNMKLSYLLVNNPVPTLVLYGTSDDETPHEILEEELKGLNNVWAERFEEAEHVRLYTRPEYKERYAQAVNNFLRK